MFFVAFVDLIVCYILLLLLQAVMMSPMIPQTIMIGNIMPISPAKNEQIHMPSINMQANLKLNAMNLRIRLNIPNAM